MSKRSLQCAAYLAVAMLAITVRAAQASGAATYKIGSRVADFAFKSDQGKTIKLSDYRGKTVVLVFFGTW